MRRFTFVIPLAVAAVCTVLLDATPAPQPLNPPYSPTPVFCYTSNHAPDSPLCSVVPGNIGADPALDIKLAYNGIVGANPTSPQNDVQTPFDNLSWQTFIALNWKSGQVGGPARTALDGTGGPRVWQTWPRVSAVFGNSKIQATCDVRPGEEVFSIASNGGGQPAIRNEEYIQAATGDPAIDVAGNWTLYERRLNGYEIKYLKAPHGQTKWNLTTLLGQIQFVADKQVIDFPSMMIPNPPVGSIEIKAAWRILDPAQHAANVKRFYVVKAVVAVAPDLVDRGPQAIVAPICAHVDLGLVAMHVMQKNMVTNNALLPQWFWTTFEHVDNAPLARNACDPTLPFQCGYMGSLSCPADTAGRNDYSYFNSTYAVMKTNVPPTKSPSGAPYAWNPAPPYAKKYLTVAGPHGAARIGTQISRCWQIYKITQKLNEKWQMQLRALGSVFANYMLVGTQWGAATSATPVKGVPKGGVPNFLSNSVVETYLQNMGDANNPFGNGSCITCHNSATLQVGNAQSNLSFLPGLVNLLQTRREPIQARP